METKSGFNFILGVCLSLGLLDTQVYGGPPLKGNAIPVSFAREQMSSCKLLCLFVSSVFLFIFVPH